MANNEEKAAKILTNEKEGETEIRDLVDKAIQAFANKFVRKDGKESTVNVTVGEFIKLLELRKELDDNAPKEITVIWKQPTETNASEK